MIGDSLLAARKAAGLSQEEVALRCHVVRQTVAKWEKGLSVPDADVLITLADVLQVPVSRLLGTMEIDPADHAALAEQLARANAALADAAAQHRLQAQASRVRGLILLVCVVTLAVAIRLGESTAGLITTGAGMLLCLALLWRSMGLLTRVTTPEADLQPIRIVTVVTAVTVIAVVVVTVLRQKGLLTFTAQGERWLLTGLVAAMMLFFGWIGPKLPYNRHTGLRLPWTVQDESTWNAAHRLLGWISLPVTLLYVAASLVCHDMGLVTGAALAVYIGVPGAVSGVHYWRKMSGKA